MTKRHQNIFQTLRDIDDRQQRSLGAKVKSSSTKRKGNVKQKRLSPNNFLLYFYAVPIGALIIIGLFEAASYDRTAYFAELGHAVFQIFLTVFGLGVIGLVAMIYSIWYLSHVRTKRRRWQYYVSIVWPVIFILLIIMISQT